jgi:acyl-CoA thioester hydrolase
MATSIDLPEALADSFHDVRPEWVDLNRHMNVAYYAVVFDNAIDGTLDKFGLGPDYTLRTNSGIFVLETHNTFVGEVKQGDRLRVSAQLLDWDQKRIHVFQRMFHAGEDYLAATSEQMFLHVDLASRKSVAMPEFAIASLKMVHSAHETLERPVQAGRVIGIVKR